MEFDNALESALKQAWKDLIAGKPLLSARVEYESKPGLQVDSLTIWALRSWGYQDRVCDYWTSPSQAHPAGLSFSNNYHSETLAQALDYIMKNQAGFERAPAAWRPHLVLIQPPTADELAQAAPSGPGPSVTASRSPMTRMTAERSPELVDNRSGFPNGPWCR